MMLALVLAAAVTLDQPSFTEVISPYLPLIGIVAGVAAAAVFNRWNARRGNVEAKMPSVKEIWDEQRKQRKELDAVKVEASDAKQKAVDAQRDRDTFKTALIGMRQAFMSYVDRVQHGGSFELTMDEHRALELPVTRPEEDDSAGS